MNRKITIAALVVAVAVAGGYALRSANRADAAAGDCYAANSGPSEPTVCN